MALYNLPSDFMGQYVAKLQRNILEVYQAQQRVFRPDGSILLTGDLSMNGNDISHANSISVGTLHYGALDPPISAGGNISGPLVSTYHGIVRYDSTTGQTVIDSNITISDDGKFEGPAGSMDFSTPGSIDIITPVVTISGAPVVTSAALSSTDSEIMIFSGTTGRVSKSSGISITAVTNKLPLAGGTMSGTINMATNNITNIGSISGSVKTSAVDALVTSSASSAVDSDIAVFDSVTGKIIKTSGVAVSTIATKLPLAGGTMSGSINMAGFNFTNVGSITGSIKTSAVNDIMTSISGTVITNNLPVFSGTTGRVITDSGIGISSLTIGAASSTNNALARFDLTTGKLLKNSSLTLSDDSKLAGLGGTIDLGTSGVINLIAGGSVQVNGSNVLTTSSIASYVQGPTSAVNNRIAAFDLATGKLIKDSGLLYTDVVVGPASATDNAVARFDLTTGKIIQNSGLILGDDSKLSGTGGSINFGTAGVLALTGTSVTINGAAAATSGTLSTYVQGPASATSGNLAIYSGTSGKVISDSGLLASSVVLTSGTAGDHTIARFDGVSGHLVEASILAITNDGKISANGSSLDFSGLNTINLITTSAQVNGSTIVTSGSLAAYVQGPASSVNNNIAAFDLATGKVIKDSGVAISAIAAKLPLAGGVMTGSINMGANNLLNVGVITGSVKSNTVDDIITSTTGAVVDSDIPIFSGTTGRVIKNSAIAITTLVIGPASATNHALARFDLTSGKLIQNSTVTLSDDAKLTGPGGIVDLSTVGIIDLVASSVRANGSAVVTNAAIAGFVTGPGSAVDSDIAVFDLTTGKVIKDSGIQVSTIATKLPLAGGTMSGSINLGGNSLTNVLNIVGSVKTSAVDALVTSSTGAVTDSDIVVFDSTTGRIIKSSGTQVSSIANKLPLAGGTMSGAINMSSNQITNTSLITFPSGNVSLGVAATGGNAVAIGNSSTAASAANTVAIGTFSTATAQYAMAIGNICSSSGLRGITLGGGNLGSNNVQVDGISIGSNNSLATGTGGIAIGAGTSIGTVNNAIAIGTGAANSTASSFLFGDSAVANIRPNNTATCDLGTTGARFKDLLLSGSISGPTNSRTADNIVSNAGTGTSGNVVTFSGASGKIIQDGGVALSSLATTASVSATYLPLAGGTMSGSINLGTNSLTNVLNIVGAVKSSPVDSLVTSSASSAVDSDITVFDSTTGKIIKSSGVAVSTIATKLPLAGGTMSGAINMGTNNITNVGSISGATRTSAVDSIVTSSTTLAVDSDIAVFDLTTGRVIKTSGVAVSTIATKLPLAGGTMTGAINMGTNNITNIGSISGATRTNVVDAIVTSSASSAADSDIAVFDLTTGKVIKNSGIQVSTIAGKLPLAGGTMSGAINMGTNNITNVGSISGATRTNVVDSLVTSSTTLAVDSDIAVFDLTTGRVIKTSGVSITAITGKLPLAGGTMTGAINMGTNNITNIGSISGAVKTSAVDSIVTSSASSAVDSDIAVFDLTTGKIIKNSGVQVSTITGKLPLAGGTMTGAINMGTNNITNIGSISGTVKTSAVDSLVTSSASSAVDSDIAIFDSTTGKIIKGSGIQVSTIAAKLPLAGGTMSGSINMGTNNLTNIGTVSGATNSRTADNIVSCAGSSVSGNIATFSGTSGKVITDSGLTLAQYALLSGATFTGAILMGANNFTTTGTVSAGTSVITGTTAATSYTTGALTCAGGIGVSGKLYSGNNVIIGAVQTVAIEQALTLRGTDSSATLGPHMVAYSATTQYPIMQSLNLAHDNAYLTYDAYNDGVSWKSSFATSNYQIAKNSGQLVFNVSPGATVGNAVTWTTAGFINTSGILQWNKVVKVTDASVSTSTSTGCLILSGGLGVAGAVNIGGTVTASGSLSGGTNSRTVDNIVSNAGAGTVGNIVTIANTSGKVVQDSGTALSALATTASVAAGYLPLVGGTLTGSINLSGNNVTNVGSISGSTKTSAVDSLVTSSATLVADSDIAVFDLTTGKIIKGSGVQVSSITGKLPLAGGTMTGSINLGTNNLTNIGTISGATNSRTADNIVSCTGTSVNGNLAMFSGTSGKVIADSGLTLAQYALLSGATFTGAILMGSNNITSTGTISAGTSVITGTTAATSYTTGALTCAGGAGITGKIYSGDNIVAGGMPSPVLLENKLTLWGSYLGATGPNIIAYTNQDAYPAYQLYSAGHFNSKLAFEMYWDGSDWISSGGPSFGIGMQGLGMAFVYNDAATAGSIIFPSIAGWIDGLGALHWNEPIISANTTASTSISTGAITSTGGIGIAGKANIGDFATIGSGTASPVLDHRLTLCGPGSSASGPHWASYTDVDQYPLIQCLSYSHENISITFDAYWDQATTSWKAGYTGQMFQITKGSSQFKFNYATSGTPGSAMTWTTAGVIASNGNLQWNKRITTSDTTASSSVITGSIVTAGGIGCNGNIFMNGNISGASAIDQGSNGTLTIGGGATGTVTIGKSGQFVNIAGSLFMTVPEGAWYSTTTYNPSFSAGVNRLTPPSSPTAGTLTEFTHSAGVLTYTGTQSRSFVVEYDITFRAGSSGSNMIFFNSKNASTTIGAAQTQARWQINASNASTFMHAHFSDNIILNTNDTVQLAGQCATLSSAVQYQYVSCKIRALMN